MKSISIFQIYFNDETKKYLDPKFIPYFNDKKDGYFENTVIKDIYEKNIQSDYIGISSWKQKFKTNLSGLEIINRIQGDIDQGKEKDVYIYSPISNCMLTADGIIPMEYYSNGIIKAPDLWAQHKAWGDGQPYRDDVILNNAKILPWDLFDGKWIYCHCNFWIVKKKVFDQYYETVVNPTLEFFERPDIKQQMPQWYEHSHEGKKYSSASFVFEGLFGAFLAHTDYTYSWIYKKKIRKHFKNINIIKYERL